MATLAPGYRRVVWVTHLKADEAGRWHLSCGLGIVISRNSERSLAGVERRRTFIVIAIGLLIGSIAINVWRTRWQTGAAR